MFERSKKAALLMKRLIAVAAVPALSILALSLAPHPTDNDASALYVVTDDAYVHVDELTADVFLTDSSAELVSRENGNDLLLTAGQTVEVMYQDTVVSTVSQEDETVSQHLSRFDINPSPLEMV